MCDKVMTDREFSVKGWNYGSAKFEGGVLSFDVSSMPAFEIPISNVSGCVTGKNEVTLEFHQVCKSFLKGLVVHSLQLGHVRTLFV